MPRLPDSQDSTAGFSAGRGTLQMVEIERPQSPRAPFLAFLERTARDVESRRKGSAGDDRPTAAIEESMRQAQREIADLENQRKARDAARQAEAAGVL